MIVRAVPARRAALAAAALVVLTAMLVIVPAGGASAHERREVGPYVFVVGFLEEPAFASVPNGVDLGIEQDGEPFVDLEDTLNVEVRFGDEAMEMTVRPFFRVGAFGTPGDYGANFIPTRAGTYTFHLTGTVGGEEIDEEFTSGPGTFDDVQDPAEVSFPIADPSNADLTERLEREMTRLASDVQGSTATDLTGRTLAAAALVVALAAVLLVGVIELRRR